jgi:hypothetical protein
MVLCTVNTNSFIPSWKCFVNAPAQITVKVYDNAGVSADASFSVAVWGTT